MAVSVVGIVNLALQRIGAKGRITSMTATDDPNAIKANTVWEMIRDEVLEEIKPKFATVRVPLAQNATDPANEDIYEFAYTMPADYLCLADGSKDDPAISPDGVKPYVIETLSAADETLCLMTNYDTTETDAPLYLTYVKRVTNPGRFSPAFINAVADRMGAELCLSVAESVTKFGAMMERYKISLRRAKAANRAQDYQDDKGSDSWETAGR